MNLATSDLSEQYTLEEIEDMVYDREPCMATCPECGHEQEVEPDANYRCPICGKGKLVSPLVKLGFI